MKNIKKRLIGWTLGLALSLGVGIGIASNTHSEIAGVEAASTTYTHPLTAKPTMGKDNKLSTVTWNVTGQNVNAYNSQNYAGVQFGTSKKNGSLSFKSKFAWGEDTGATNYLGKTKIEFVKVWLNKGGGTVSADVKIGGTAATSDGTTVVKNSKAGSSYTNTSCVTFTPTNNADSGIIEINASSTAAGYFSAIEVIATEGVQKNLTSIEITTPPTKIEYYSGEKFDPTGLVVTKTFDDNTTEDLPYNDSNKDSFTFSPELTAELKTTDDVVAITVGGETVKQSITVKPARTITSVTLDGDMDKKDYYEGDAWDVSGLHLTVNWNEGEPTTIQLTDLKNGYFLDSDNATIGTTSLYITGTYNGFDFEKTVEGLTVTERPSAVKIAYEAAKNLGLKGETTVDYEFSGVVVGTIGNSFFVQDKDYGMYVYNHAVSGLAVGKTIGVKSTLQTYSGTIETKSVSSATLGDEAAVPTSATISSAADLKALKQNVLVDLEAVMPATLGDWTPGQKGANALNTLTVGADEIVMKFDKFAYNKSSVSGIYSSLVGKKVSIKNAVSSAHGALEANQLLLTEQTTIEVIKDDYNDALTFGTSFLNKTAAACADGTKDNSEVLKTAWTALTTEFNALSDGAKKVVKGAVANDAGTDLEKAMARYDHIVKRYSAAHTEISDFIGRGVTASLTNQLFKANTTNNIMVISLIACASVAAIGSFFFIRKRKEQN